MIGNASKATRITFFMRRPRPGQFSIERVFEDIRAAMPSDIAVHAWTCKNYSNGILARLSDMWQARQCQAEVNHVTGDVHYLTFLLDPKRTVLTVHDLVLLERSRGLKWLVCWLLWYWLPIRRSHVVVAVSASTREQILRTVGCAPEKVHLIHNGVSSEFRREPRPFNVEYPRILHIGTSANKNLDRVAHALAGIRCRLVILGKLSDHQLGLLRYYGIDFENTSGLSRSAMVAQYAAADLVLFASTYEGFGLPIVEANAVGRPVVTSTLFSLPEVAGTAACLVDPFDVSSIRAGVLKVVSDAAYRESLIQNGFANVERFNIVEVAEEYASIYRKVADESGRPAQRRWQH